MSWQEHNLTDYPSYFQTKWWQQLKQEHIYSNSQAQCWISHKKNNLLLHHVNYGALYKEKLGRDIYILNYDHHDQVHFWLFRLIKVPLTTNALLFSMRLRRSIFCLQNRQFGLFLIWLVVSLVIGSFYFLIWLFTKTTKGLFRSIDWSLKFILQ